MGCTASNQKKGSIFSVKIRADPVVTSSGLLVHSDENINSNLLEVNQIEKEKLDALGHSLSSCSDIDQYIQVPKARQSTTHKLPTVKLPPKDPIYQNFSFKHSPESSTDKEKEVILNHSFNPSLGGHFEIKGRKEDKSLTATFLKPNSMVIESKSTDRHPVLTDISNSSFRNSSIVDSKFKENEETNSCSKNVVDMAGLTFSFMNIRQENYNQPTVFYSEENKQMNFHPEKYFQNPFNNKAFAVPKGNDGHQNNNEERLMSLSEVSSLSCQSTARGNQETKVLKTDDSKEVRSPHDKNHLNMKGINPPQDPTKLNVGTQFGQGSAVSTNIGSVGTVTSLANISKEDSKKVALSQRFRRNLVDLVRDGTKNEPQSLKSLTVKSWNTFGDLIERDEKKNSLAIKSKVASDISPHIGSRRKASSFKKLDMRVNLVTLTKEEEDDEDGDSENDFDFTHKHSLSDEKSLEFQGLELLDDEGEISPNAQFSVQNQTRSNTPKALQISNSSFSRQIDSSTFLDKTIYNLEDNITRLDLDKYSIYEYVANVEVDNRDETSGIDNTYTNRILDAKELNTSINHSRSYKKMRNTVLDTQESNQTPSHTGTPQKRLENKYRLRPKTIHDIEKGCYSETQTPKAYLSPDTIPHKSFTVLPKEKSRTPELNRTTSVIETKQVDKSVDEEGQKKINQYLLIKDLGKGSFGKVKLALHCETKQQYAVKIANKKRLKKKLLSRSSSAYTQLATEVAIMKKMDHPNIVKLVEVIDDPNNDNLYIAMEYIKKGAVLSRNYWRNELNKVGGATLNELDSENMKMNRLTEEKAKKYFRHLVLALDYLHNTVGIIHRDIKPENLLISEDDTLKVSDFGISKIMENGDDLLDTNAGTKLYLAPETWKGKSFRGKPADIWAVGGTLYYFLTGKSPFHGFLVDDVKRKILEEDIRFPSDINLNPTAIDLIKACLIKDPEKRITLEEIMKNSWVTDNGKNPLENYSNRDLTPNEEDINRALTKISFMAVVLVTAKVRRKANIARMNVERKKSQEPNHSLISKERL